MDFKKFDRARRQVGPVQLDLVESYAKGVITRRQFIRRGTVIGLSVPLMSAIIAACGDDSGSSTTTAAGTTTTGGATTTAGATTSAAPTTTGASVSGGTIKVATQKPSALDPIAMQDLGAYGIIAQCFEFLVTLGDGGQIAPGLAESWSANTDLTEWTFNLRAAKWQDGTDFTSADVAATMDRLAAAGNAGLKGVIDQGSVDASDPKVAKIKLLGPNGNFPYLVSVFNAQAVITPKAFATGTILGVDNANGTGPWKLSKFDAATGATFVRNDTWWGGKTPLDSTEFQFFEDLGAMVTAMQSKSVDAIVQFQIVGGDALLGDSGFNTIEIQTTNHRQIWMRCDKGQFAKKEVRQALAYSLDRDVMLKTLFDGHGEVANDHIIAPFLPFFDDSVPQRTRDVEKAKALLAQAGVTGTLKAVLHIGDLQEIPDLAQIVQSNAKDAGFDLSIDKVNNNDFYGQSWCPATPADPPCSGATELGIVDYGHRPTPDVFLNSALATKGVWNSSQYSSADFDAAFKEYQGTADVAGQKAACKKIETILNEDVPISVPYFYNYLSGHSKKFANIRTSALGQMFLDRASKA